MDRITNTDIDQALERLARALAAVGWQIGDDEWLELRQPYGQVYYVVSYNIANRASFAHDVPGFQGSSGGYASKRDAYDAINQTARTLFDLSPWGSLRLPA